MCLHSVDWVRTDFSLRLRLGIGMALEGDRCAVFKQNTHTSCGRLLTPHADHAPGCAKAARNAGHNAVRDWYAGVLREAGGRALTEQWVVEYMPRKHVRADVRAVVVVDFPF